MIGFFASYELLLKLLNVYLLFFVRLLSLFVLFILLIYLLVLFFHSLNNIIIKYPNFFLVSLRLRSISPSRLISILYKLSMPILDFLLRRYVCFFLFFYNFQKLFLCILIFNRLNKIKHMFHRQ